MGHPPLLDKSEGCVKGTVILGDASSITYGRVAHPLPKAPATAAHELQFRFVCRRFGFRYFFFGVSGCHNSILLPSGS